MFPSWRHNLKHMGTSIWFLCFHWKFPLISMSSVLHLKIHFIHLMWCLTINFSLYLQKGKIFEIYIYLKRQFGPRMWETAFQLERKQQFNQGGGSSVFNLNWTNQLILILSTTRSYIFWCYWVLARPGSPVDCTPFLMQDPIFHDWNHHF